MYQVLWIHLLLWVPIKRKLICLWISYFKVFAKDYIQIYSKFVICWKFNFGGSPVPMNSTHLYPTNNNESTTFLLIVGFRTLTLIVCALVSSVYSWVGNLVHEPCSLWLMPNSNTDCRWVIKYQGRPLLRTQVIWLFLLPYCVKVFLMIKYLNSVLVDDQVFWLL